MRLLKSILASIISALITSTVLPTCVGLNNYILFRSLNNPEDSEIWIFVLFTSVFYFAIILTGLLFIGLPLQAVMQALGLNRLWHVAMPTTIAGCVIGSFIAMNNFFGSVILYSGLGLIMGAVFWFIRRPDKDDMPQRKKVPLPQVHNRNAD